MYNLCKTNEMHTHDTFFALANLVPPPLHVYQLFMYPEVEGTHHINNADVSAYLLMDFVMRKGMNLSQASQW